MPLFDSRTGPSYGTIENEHSSYSQYSAQEQYSERVERGEQAERNRLLQDNQQYDPQGEESEVSSLDEAQEGVRKIEAINMTWTTRSLIIAYVRFVLLAAVLLADRIPTNYWLALKYILDGLLYVARESNRHVSLGLCDQCF